MTVSLTAEKQIHAYNRYSKCNKNVFFFILVIKRFCILNSRVLFIDNKFWI